MIRKVKFSNFYSFEKEQEISFLAKKKKTYDYHQSKSGDQITKVAGFIGGNASGKTNAMRLFSFLSYFICRDIDNNSSLIAEIGYKNFFKNNNPSKFSIEFEIDNQIFLYEFSIKNNIILKESLSIWDGQKNTSKTIIFARQAGIIKELNKSYFQKITIESLPKIREDISFITFIKKSTYSVDIINNIYSYFFEIKTNINEIGEINSTWHRRKILKACLNDPALKKEVDNFIRHFDIGLNGIEIKKEVEERGVVFSIQGVHSTNVKNNRLDFNYESRGTQSLFSIIVDVLLALKNNNIVIIDEIESGLHPEAVDKLINYFIDENKNKKAQLIFSSHSLGFMNKLDMHQIFLLEKNSNSESSICRLNQVEGIRTDENFLNKYMAGAYGAFPKIRI